MMMPEWKASTLLDRKKRPTATRPTDLRPLQLGSGRRGGRGGLGSNRGGSRKGLGFAPVKKEGADGEKEGGENAKAKSNADFRAMLLKGKSEDEK